ncbi:MAG: 3-isopropylmalate dehydratase [Burkholderiaceae bacterium]
MKTSPSVIQGVTMVLGDRVNTDIHCSTKYLPGRDNQFVVGCAFQELSPGFAEQAAQYRQAGQPIVLLAGADFGINSSREQAAQILKEMGVSVVVAKSFARAFFRNAMNNGLALITAPVDGPVAGQSVTVDLLAGRVTQGDRVVAQGAGLSPVLMQIISAGGLLPLLQQNKGWPDLAAAG